MLPRLLAKGWLVPPLLLLLVIAVPGVITPLIGERDLILIGIYCLVAAGINLSLGYGGELALGQVAVMAAGSYTAVVLGANRVTDILVTLLVSGLVGAGLGLLTGLPGLRLSKWALGLVSFFLITLLPGVVVSTREHTGGLEGTLVAPPTLFGADLDIDGLLVVTLVVAGLWFAIFRNLVLSNYGLALVSLRATPRLVESLGVSSNTMRLGSYVIGAIPAALGGVLYAHLAGYISPSPFTLSLLLAVLAVSIFGGSDSIYGPIIGAVLVVLGPSQIEALEEYSLAVYGAFLLLIAVLFRQGVAGLARRFTSRLFSRGETVPDSADTGGAGLPDLAGACLEVEGVVRHFGGVAALNGARLEALPGAVTAIIGSNGAGKTTMLNTVCGFIRPEAGTMTLDGRSILGLSAVGVARTGVSRAFQTPAIPEGMTVLDVVRSGALRSTRLNLVATVLRFPSFRRQRRRSTEMATALLRLANLDHRRADAATSLPLGSRRLLEVLRAAAGSPKVILLDEPAAGLDESALRDLSGLLAALKQHGATIVLIEHNVPFVMSVADTVFAMDLGRTIAAGDPEKVRRTPEVINSYLGRPPATVESAAATQVEGADS
jgi:branched-chain amino acid transport system permease protein